MKALQSAAPLELAIALRGSQLAAEDLDFYLKVGRPWGKQWRTFP